MADRGSPPGPIWRRALGEERRALVAWAVGTSLSVLAELALYPTVRDNDMSQVLEGYPEAVKEMFNISDLASGTGFVNAELFSLVVPLLLLIPAILWGSDGVAGEEERRTLDLLLANPVPRRRVVIERFGAMATAVVLIAVPVLGMFLLGGAAFDLGIGTVELVAAMAATTLLAVLYGGLALAIGAATGHRGLARGLSAALAVGAYLLSTLAALVGWLEPWRALSPWYHALGVDPLVAGLDPVRLLGLAVATVALVAAGTVAFDRRDLGT